MWDEESLRELVQRRLDQAERTWKGLSPQLLAKDLRSLRSEAFVPTQIPGFPKLAEGQSKVGEFIAFVADLRGSTSHLLQRISARETEVTQLQRVFYEASALLPALATTIHDQSGSVVEYLGDGLLALFEASEDGLTKSLYSSYRAATLCLKIKNEIVNPELKQRYSLPPLKIGIGMGYSKSIVSLVGVDNFLQPKVIGESVYRAAKLSSGSDEIYVDREIYERWPTKRGGILTFKRVKMKELTGYRIGRK